MKKKALFILAGLWIATLTGCGQGEIPYGETADLDSQEEVVEKHSGTLRDLLGMKEEHMWEENIEGKDGSVKIKAVITVPDTSNLYTMTATKYSLTADDKRKIAEHFMDADTIKVERDFVLTKERIQAEIDEQESRIAELSVSNVEEETIAYEEQVREKLEEQLLSAPSADEVKDEPGDYSANYYVGSKGDQEYRLVFGDDYWFTNSCYVDNSGTFSWGIIKEEYSDEENETLQPDTDNDKMTEEEACSLAKRICGELGLSDMSVAKVDKVDPFDIVIGSGRPLYMIDLVRNINGVLLDGVPLDSDIYVERPYLEEEWTMRPYEQERVRITISNHGWSQISYEGSMKVGEIGDAVKLLSYSQIQELFRKELGTMEIEEDDSLPIWRVLELSYMRVADESNPDLFCYIPVWRLSRQNDDWGDYSTKDNIWLNAIDGSRIYPEEVGAARFTGYPVGVTE